MIFDLLKLTKSWKFKKIGRFRTKQGPFTQNFAKKPNIFLVPKVLRIICYPWKHSSQGQKLKTGQKKHFFGTPCSCAIDSSIKSSVNSSEDTECPQKTRF